MNLPVNFIIWGIIFLLYFSLKDFLLTKIFKELKKPFPWYVSLVIAVLALMINRELASAYNRYLNMAPIKGSIHLPPFQILFILADFIGTLIFMFSLIGAKKAIYKTPVFRAFVSIGSLITLWIVFLPVVGGFWVRELEKSYSREYFCFKDQLTIDMAAFYFENHRYPQTIEEFTSCESNPANNSPLKIDYSSDDGVVVVDEAGNKILYSTSDDLLIWEIYQEDPKDYFKRFQIKNETYCQNSLHISEKYYSDLSCQYKGNSYSSGERFPAGDSCNTCICEGGKVICTLKACD